MMRGLSILLLTLSISAHGDIFSYIDSAGVTHFTNIKPKGKTRKKWKRILKEKPSATSKPAAKRGACERCDAVPAKDRSPARYSRYDAYIKNASQLYQIPETLIRAVIKVESDYDPRVVSSVGARGLMQLMPAAAKEMGVNDPHDPEQCILGGTRYLRILANRYKGDTLKTIAAYHAGPGSLKKYGNQIPPYKNTQKYLRMVLKQYDRFRKKELVAPKH